MPAAKNRVGSALDLSVIIPLYNEESNVAPLYTAIVQAVEPLGLAFEIVLVDDGSRDNTFANAARLAGQDKRIRVIKFRRNYGQTAAMVAGIDHARGRTLVTMDGDLQNDPSDIPELLKKIDEGYHIVAGWRMRRQDTFATRVLPSKIANWLIGLVTGVPIRDNGCSLKAYRADLIKNIPLYSEMHRFIPAMTSLAGAQIAQIPVRHHPRRFGVSKYGLSRVYKVLLDLLTIKSVLILATRPLFIFTSATILSALFGFILLAFVLIHSAIMDVAPSLVLINIGLLSSVLSIFLACLGLLGQLVYKTGTITTQHLSALTAMLVRDDGDERTKA